MAETKRTFWKHFSLKELTSTAIAVLIVGLNAYLFYMVLTLANLTVPQEALSYFPNDLDKTQQAVAIWEGMTDARYDRAKEILMLATGFLGIVLGYYFGRITAESALDKVGEQAEVAAQTAQDATQRAAVVETENKILADENHSQAIALETVTDAGRDLVTAVQSGEIGGGDGFSLESTGEHPAVRRMQNALTITH